MLPDRFRDYLIDQILTKEYKTNMREIETALADPNTPEKRKESLRAMIEIAERQAALYNLLASQTGLLRLYPEERREYWDNRAKAIEAMTGLTTVQQEEVRDKGLRVADVVSLSPEQSRILNYLEGSEWAGITSALRPLSMQDQMDRQDRYWSRVDALQQERYQGQAIDDYLLSIGKMSKALHYQNRTERWNKYIYALEELKHEYADVPKTWEESAEVLKERGIWTAPPHPVRQLLDDYYSIKMPLNPDGTEDYEGYEELRTEFILNIPENYREEVVRELLRNRTPYEQQEHFSAELVRHIPSLKVGELYQNTLAMQELAQVEEAAKRYGVPEEVLELEPEQAIGATVPAGAPLGVSAPTRAEAVPMETQLERRGITPEIIRAITRSLERGLKR